MHPVYSLNGTVSNPTTWLFNERVLFTEKHTKIRRKMPISPLLILYTTDPGLPWFVTVNIPCSSLNRILQIRMYCRSTENKPSVAQLFAAPSEPVDKRVNIEEITYAQNCSRIRCLWEVVNLPQLLLQERRSSSIVILRIIRISKLQKPRKTWIQIHQN